MPGFEVIGKEERDAVNEVFDKGGVLYRYGLDEKRQYIYRVDDFEKEIAKKVGVQYCHCVCNGTAALKIALFALELNQEMRLLLKVLPLYLLLRRFWN